MRDKRLKITKTPQFARNYRARIRTHLLKKAVAESIRHFLEEPSAPALRDHELRHSMKKLRAFSVTEDVRIVYLLTKKGAIFLDIGTHESTWHTMEDRTSRVPAC